MKELIEYLAKSLVDHPEEVQVRQLRGARGTVLRLSVDPSDKGWVIGRRGRVANAMRTALYVAAVANGTRQVTLEIA
ncbi:MAG: KH domain-containing protein [Chloroflexota bacterium]